MTQLNQHQLVQALHDSRGTVADAWQRAIGRTSYVGLEAGELRMRLLELTDAAIAILVAEEFDVAAARGIGIGVSKLGFVLPEALGGTLETLARGLVEGLRPTQAAGLQPRLAQLLGGIASGFADRSRVALLHEQETIRRALLTMREEAEDALRESEARFRAIFEGAAFGITVTDMSGNILQTNRALQSVLGRGENEMRGHLFTEFVHRDDVASAWDAFQRLLTTSADRTETELRFAHSDGRDVWAHFAVSLVHDADGHPQFAIGMAEDVTQRKRAEEERIQLLRAQAARTEAEAAQRRVAFLADVSNRLASSLDYETTLAHVTRSVVPMLADWAALYLVNAAGELQTETVTHVDPAHERLVIEMRRRYPRRPENSPALAVLRTGKSRLLTSIDDELLDRISRDAEHRAMWTTLAPCSMMIVPLIAHSRNLGVLSLIATHDSGRHYSESDLALAEDLGRRAALALENAQLYAQAQDAIRTAEDAVRLRDEFLSVAAHELKTPVTSLRGFAQLTLRTIDQTGNVEIGRLYKALGVVDQQSDKLTRLVAQLLDVSRFQSGRLRLDRRDTDVSQLVTDLVRSMQSHSSRHELIAHVPPNLHAYLDPLRFEQVLTNLIDNAIKYSPDGGAVDIELAQPEPGWLRLAVRDRGIGVKPADRERIFERFFQADASVHHAAGMGLGLYISRQIIDMHGGHIAAEAPPDGGTRVVVSLPQVRPESGGSG